MVVCPFVGFFVCLCFFLFVLFCRLFRAVGLCGFCLPKLQTFAVNSKLLCVTFIVYDSSDTYESNGHKGKVDDGDDEGNDEEDEDCDGDQNCSVQ